MLPSPSHLVHKNDLVTFLNPRSKEYQVVESFENGGVALYDTSEGLLKYEWVAWTDGSAIYCKRVDQTTHSTLFKAENITEIDFTFDQNMRPCFTFVTNNICKIYWYNTLIANFEVTDLYGIKNPRVSLDDKRTFNVANSDIILAYINSENNLCCRYQRERFTIEHQLSQLDGATSLVKIGMDDKNRFSFKLRKFEW